jgi:hypothetical protein
MKVFDPLRVLVENAGRLVTKQELLETDASRSAYEALLGLWQDADADTPIVRAARREHRAATASR